MAGGVYSGHGDSSPAVFVRLRQCIPHGWRPAMSMSSIITSPSVSSSSFQEGILDDVRMKTHHSVSSFSLEHAPQMPLFTASLTTICSQLLFQ